MRRNFTKFNSKLINQNSLESKTTSVINNHDLTWENRFEPLRASKDKTNDQSEAQTFYLKNYANLKYFWSKMNFRVWKKLNYTNVLVQKIWVTNISKVQNILVQNNF